MVDELQDFGLEALRLIAALSPIGQERNPLCVVGDGHQRLYGNVPIPLSRAGIEVVGRSRRLKTNYRTSEQIRSWAHQLLNEIDVDDLDGSTTDTTGDRSVFRGAEPQLETCSDGKTAAHALENWINGLSQAGYKLHEICIAHPTPEMIIALESAAIPTLELKARQRDPGKDEKGVRYGTNVAATRAREHLLVISLG